MKEDDAASLYIGNIPLSIDEDALLEQSPDLEEYISFKIMKLPAGESRGWG